MFCTRTFSSLHCFGTEGCAPAISCRDNAHCIWRSSSIPCTKVHNVGWWHWKRACRPKCQPSTAFVVLQCTLPPRFIIIPRLNGKHGSAVIFTTTCTSSAADIDGHCKNNKRSHASCQRPVINCGVIIHHVIMCHQAIFWSPFDG